jgi:hypothetical protein
LTEHSSALGFGADVDIFLFVYHCFLNRERDSQARAISPKPNTKQPDEIAKMQPGDNWVIYRADGMLYDVRLENTRAFVL